MRFPRNIIIALLAAALVVTAEGGAALKIIVDGFRSRFVVIGDACLFTQPDESLTELDLNTGAVRRRLKGLDLGDLIASDGGYLVTRTGQVFDTATSRVVWRMSGRVCGAANGRVISVHANTEYRCRDTSTGAILSVPDDQCAASHGDFSGEITGDVECRETSTGALLWSFPVGSGRITTAWGIVSGEHFLFFRGERCGGGVYEDDPTTMSLHSTGTGELLFEKGKPDICGRLQRFYVGEDWVCARIWTRPYGPAVPECDCYPGFEGVVAWDYAGREVGRIPTGEFASQTSCQIILGQRVLDDNGRIYRVGTYPQTAGQTMCSITASSVTLQAGVFSNRVLNECNADPWSPLDPTVLSFTGQNEKWRVFTEIGVTEDMNLRVLEVGGRILIGHETGVVECLDARTGKSRWRYVFPFLGAACVYSWGGELYGVEDPVNQILMRVWTEQWWKNKSERGCVTIPDGVPETCWRLESLRASASLELPPPILDPDPTNVFPPRRLIVASAWSRMVILPLLLVLYFAVRARCRLGTLASSFGAVVVARWTAVLFGQFSIGTMLLGTACSLVGWTCLCVFTWRSLFEGRRRALGGAALFAAALLLFLPTLTGPTESWRILLCVLDDLFRRT